MPWPRPIPTFPPRPTQKPRPMSTQTMPGPDTTVAEYFSETVPETVTEDNYEVLFTDDYTDDYNEVNTEINTEATTEANTEAITEATTEANTIRYTPIPETMQHTTEPAQIQPGDCHLYDWHQDHDHDHEDEHHGLTLEQDSFYHYDTDRDCRINIQEFLLADLPPSLRFADYDVNGDEILTYAEFIELHEVANAEANTEVDTEPNTELNTDVNYELNTELNSDNISYEDYEDYESFTDEPATLVPATKLPTIVTRSYGVGWNRILGRRQKSPTRAPEWPKN